MDTTRKKLVPYSPPPVRARSLEDHDSEEESAVVHDASGDEEVDIDQVPPNDQVLSLGVDANAIVADIVAKLSGPATKASSSQSGKKKKENDDALAAKVRTMVATYFTNRGNTSVEIADGSPKKATPSGSKRGPAKKKKAAPKKKVAAETETIEISDGPMDGALVEGDSMYPDDGSNSTVFPRKRLRPTTPPLSTRRAAAESLRVASTSTAHDGSVPTEALESPPKRKRIDDGQSTPQKKIHVVQHGVDDGDYAIALKSALDKKMDFHEESVQVQDVFGVVPVSIDQIQEAGSDDTTAKNMVHLLQKRKEVAIDSDEEVFPGGVISTPSPSTNPLAPQIPIAVLPKTCEVNDVQAQDAWLKAKNYYANLPPLRFGRILPLRPATHQFGNPYFSQWGSVVPNFKIKVAYNILKFTEDRNFVNFSLISPPKIGTRLVNIFSSRYEFIKDGTTAIGVSCGMVSQSQLESVSAQLKYPYHQLSLTPHCQDAERLESCLCMIAGKNTLIGQTYKNAISFQTNVAPATDNVASKFSPPTSFLNTYSSPKKGLPRSQIRLPNYIGPLEFAKKVPVYDARATDSKFIWTAKVFENLEEHFKIWEGEVPSSSFAAVGYCVQIFKANDKLPEVYRKNPQEPEDMWKVTNYVQWVLVFGTPPGWMDPVRGWVEPNEGKGN